MLHELAGRMIDKLDLPPDFKDAIKILLSDHALLQASLCSLVHHWRTFGPEYGFDELLDEVADRHGLE